MSREKEIKCFNCLTSLSSPLINNVFEVILESTY
jgi:hypothetical protein